MNIAVCLNSELYIFTPATSGGHQRWDLRNYIWESTSYPPDPKIEFIWSHDYDVSK